VSVFRWVCGRVSTGFLDFLRCLHVKKYTFEMYIPMIHFVCVEWLSLGSMWPASRPWLAAYKESYYVYNEIRGTLCRF